MIGFVFLLFGGCEGVFLFFLCQAGYGEKEYCDTPL